MSPMITKRTLNIYGFVSIAIMLLLLALVWFQAVPTAWYYPLFFVAAALFVTRIALRFIHARQKSQLEKENDGLPPTVE